MNWYHVGDTIAGTAVSLERSSDGYLAIIDQPQLQSVMATESDPWEALRVVRRKALGAGFNSTSVHTGVMNVARRVAKAEMA
jgi:hypothetical protein